VPVKFVTASAVAVAALVLFATASTAGAARGASRQVGGFVPHVSRPGHVLPARRTAKAGRLNCVATCTAYESTINQYFTDVAADNGLATNVYSVATQYSDNTGSIAYDETFDASTNSYVDTNPYPASYGCHDGYDKYCVTDQQLQAEIGKVIKANHLPTLSTTTLYFIFTPANTGVCIYPGVADNSNPCTTNLFCAYHSASPKFIYAVEPDAAAAYGGICTPRDAGNPEAPAGNSADATINTISHEQNEAITDPFPGQGWISNNVPYPEIGDLCAYDFGTPQGPPGAEYNQVINGHNYFLQLEYSNQDNGCVPYLGGPVTAPPNGDGSGPLVWQGGSPVMRTNTVYAIYWVPAKPVNNALPTISGTAKVGKTLRASNGKWSNGPKFTHRWLRCSSAGTSCKAIAGATGGKYTLVAADAHHRIEVRVTGTNMAGHVSVASAPTGSVRA
jgi:hypothetical protein